MYVCESKREDKGVKVGWIARIAICGFIFRSNKEFLEKYEIFIENAQNSERKRKPFPVRLWRQF